MAKEMGGLMIWELTQDMEGEHSVLSRL